MKFFRRIRQKLLNQTKISKYLLYSLGEIVLVVIGILIALKINNWNQGCVERKSLYVILEEIRRDLEKDIEIFTDDLSMCEDRILANSWGLSKTNYENVPEDSLINYLITNYRDNKISDFGFTKLQNFNTTANFDLEGLLDKIKQFYLIKGEKFNIMIDWEKKYSTEYIIWMSNLDDSWEWTYIVKADTYLSAEDEFPSLKTDGQNLKIVKRIATNVIFRNYKYDDLRRKRIMKSFYEDMLEESRNLIDAITLHTQKG